MAKGKRSKGTNYTSKGERSNVGKWVKKAMRRDKSILETMIDKENAKKQGKNTKEGGLHKNKWVPWHVGVAEYRRKFNGKND